MAKHLIKFDEKTTEICYYESNRDVSAEEVKDFCECNEMEIPEEGSRKWWDIVDEFRDIDLDDFKTNYECSSAKLGKIVVRAGSCSPRYADFYGSGECRHGYAVIDASTADGLLIPAENEDYFKVYSTKEGLFIDTANHDLSTTIEIRALTKKGEKYVETHENSNQYEVNKHVFETKGLSSQVKHYLF